MKSIAEIQMLHTKIVMGDIDILKGYKQLKDISQEIARVMKEVEPIVLDEAAKYGNGGANIENANISYTEGRVMWDFTNVSRHKQAKLELKQLEGDLVRAAQSAERGVFSVTDDGEQISELPIKKFSKPSIRVKYEK